MSTHASSAQGVGVRTTDHQDGYFEFTRPELRALVPATARRVLDVGCGGGALGAALKADHPGMEVMGLEGFPDAAATAATRLDRVEVVNLDAIESLPEGMGMFDAIVFGDVLEHLLDPERLLGVMRAALTPGGVLVMSIPNLDHWSVVIPALLQDRWTYTDAGLLDRSHVHLFTLEEISDLLGRLALDATHLSFNDHAPIPGNLQPLANLVARETDDVNETLGRLRAYQYIVAATPGGGTPAPSASAGTGPRRVHGGLEEMTPAGHTPVDLAPGGDHGPVLDDVVRARLAAASVTLGPKAYALDGVLSHVREPERLLPELHDAMEPGDVALFSVPNVAHWETLLGLTLDDRWTYGLGPLADHPIRFITRAELEELLGHAGLAVREWVDETTPLPERHAALASAGELYGVPAHHVRAILERRVMRVAVGRV